MENNIEQGIIEINKILKKRKLSFWNSEWFGIGDVKSIIFKNHQFEIDFERSVELTSETKKGLLKIA